jgi:hypothetical protein
MPKGTRLEKNVKPPALGDSTTEEAAGAGSLPCLYSNNGIQITPLDSQEKAATILGLCNLLSPYHKRQAHTLFSNVHRLVTKVAPSPGHVGFLTLTFPDNLTDNKEVRERFRSFNTNYLSSHPHIREWVNTKEVQKRGAWHFHLVVVLTEDIGQGVSWGELEKGNYRSVSPFLRNLWKDLRENLPNYGFGRSELLPVKSGPDAIARYVGKYISKHIGNRTEEQKGVRLVSYSKGWLRNGCQFAWNTQGAAQWRRKLSLFAERHGCTEFYQLSAKLGAGWAYRFAQDIMDIDKTIMEEKINAKHEGREITRTQYKDPTINRAKDRKAAREKKLIKKLELHTKRPFNLEEKRKVEIAKQGAEKWLQGQKGKEKTEEKEISGWAAVINGKLVIRSGERAGEELF